MKKFAIILALAVVVLSFHGAAGSTTFDSPLPPLPPPPAVEPRPACPDECEHGCIWSYPEPRPLPDPLECYEPEGEKLAKEFETEFTPFLLHYYWVTLER